MSAKSYLLSHPLLWVLALTGWVGAGCANGVGDRIVVPQRTEKPVAEHPHEVQAVASGYRLTVAKKANALQGSPGWRWELRKETNGAFTQLVVVVLADEETATFIEHGHATRQQLFLIASHSEGERVATLPVDVKPDPEGTYDLALPCEIKSEELAVAVADAKERVRRLRESGRTSEVTDLGAQPPTGWPLLNAQPAVNGDG